jgi:hypothetical protein
MGRRLVVATFIALFTHMIAVLAGFALAAIAQAARRADEFDDGP